MFEETMKTPEQTAEEHRPVDRDAYINHGLNLPVEDMRFLEGYLFAHVSALSRKPA